MRLLYRRLCELPSCNDDRTWDCIDELRTPIAKQLGDTGCHMPVASAHVSLAALPGYHKHDETNCGTKHGNLFVKCKEAGPAGRRGTTYIYIYVYVYMYVFVYMSVFVYMRMFICMYIYIRFYL